jgi:hypothetical protein
MVDLQRLVLEKKRYKRESVTLVVAVLALIVSVGGTLFAVQPTLQKSAERANAAHSYLSALSTSGVNDAFGALTYAEAESPASQFASTVTKWRQAQTGTDSEFKDGYVKTGADDSYSLCLPALSVPLFPERCVSISNFDYSQENDVREFTIDGIPSGSLVRKVKSADLAEGGVGPMRVFPVAAVVSPDGVSETLVYSLLRTRESDRQYPVTFRSVEFQDDQEATLASLSEYFPEQVGYWENSSAVIQVPGETAFMLLCWGGVKDHRGGCDWTYELGDL